MNKDYFCINPETEIDPESIADDSVRGWTVLLLLSLGFSALFSMGPLFSPNPFVSLLAWGQTAWLAYVFAGFWLRLRNTIFTTVVYLSAVALMNLIAYLNGVGSFNDNMGFSHSSLYTALLCAVWIVYMFRSKALEARYPKASRRIFWWDWVLAVVLFALPTLLFAVSLSMMK